MPCLEAMSTRWALSLLLNLLLDIIGLVLLFLCGVLVYSLLGVDVESRTGELGVLRLLGARRRRLVVLMLAHAAVYALPALVVALAFSQALMPLVAPTIVASPCRCAHLLASRLCRRCRSPRCSKS